LYLCPASKPAVAMLETPQIEQSHLAVVEGLKDKERKAVFEIQTEILSAMTKRLVEKGFKWILPVMLAKSTDPLWPDSGASIEKRIELEIYGEKVRAMQSMIIHKMTLVSLGPERFFILSPNIRMEKRERAKTGSHLYEFTQLEIELAEGKMDDVFRIFEDLIKTSVRAVREQLKGRLRKDVRTPKTPFKVYRRRDLEEKYGEVWAESVSNEIENPVWITDMPREFYDFEDEKSGTWRNYDLFLPEGYGEVISGAEREHDYSRIVKKIERDGLSKEDYGLLLSLAKNGKLKPSAGAGLGIERFIAYVCGVSHVAQVQPFPRVPGVVPEL
jgi:asparaginyl-tRNA synthetase